MRADAFALVPAPLALVSRSAGHADNAPALRVFRGDGHALGASGVNSLRRSHEVDLKRVGRRMG